MPGMVHLLSSSTACKHTQAVSNNIMSQGQLSALPICNLFCLLLLDYTQTTVKTCQQTMDCMEECHILNPCRTLILACLQQER